MRNPITMLIILFALVGLVFSDEVIQIGAFGQEGELIFPQQITEGSDGNILVTGDDGKLLVATFEEGVNPGEFMYDIFNEDGAFIGRKSLNIWIWEGHLWAQMRGNKFYSLTEKANGYKALYVYNMKWE